MDNYNEMFGGSDLDDGAVAETSQTNAKYSGRLEAGFTYARSLVDAGWVVDKDEVNASPLTVIRGQKMRSTVAALYHPEITSAAVKLFAKGSLVMQNCYGIGDDSAPEPEGFRLQKTW